MSLLDACYPGDDPAPVSQLRTVPARPGQAVIISPGGPLRPTDSEGNGRKKGGNLPKLTVCLADHDLYMKRQACIVTLCGGAAPRGAPVRAMYAKHAVPPSASGLAAAPPPYSSSRVSRVAFSLPENFLPA